MSNTRQRGAATAGPPAPAPDQLSARNVIRAEMGAMVLPHNGMHDISYNYFLVFISYIIHIYGAQGQPSQTADA
jgi:hypothetical protein